jgi:hypothetical protein
MTGQKRGVERTGQQLEIVVKHAVQRDGCSIKVQARIRGEEVA